MASGSPAVVRVLERHGFDCCAGAGRCFADVCHELGLEEDVVRAEIAAAEPAQDDRDWTSAPLRELMHHLVCIDHAEVRADLPILERQLQHVIEECSAAHPHLLKLPPVFRNLATELEAHMQGEERELFPAIERYIEAMECGEPLKGSPLAAFGGPLHLMEQEHESTGAALRLLREFCRNYNTPEHACPVYRALLQGLAALEERLARHMYLENTILYPRAAALNASRRRQESPSARV